MASVGIVALYEISIHTLRVEGDRSWLMAKSGQWIFLSTPSVWRVTIEPIVDQNRDSLFLSTPSVWRVTPTE